MHIIKVLDAILLSFIVGSTLWFFFIQTPALLKKMGKEKFIPLQMHLTKIFFTALAIASFLMLALSAIHAFNNDHHVIVTALVVFVSASIAHFLVIPRALRAGGQSLRSDRSEMTDSVAEFASVGGSDNSKFWHRMVVLFVVFVLMGSLGHGIHLLA